MNREWKINNKNNIYWAFFQLLFKNWTKKPGKTVITKYNYNDSEYFNQLNIRQVLFITKTDRKTETPIQQREEVDERAEVIKIWRLEV